MSLIQKYILDDRGRPVVEPDLLKWGQWMQTANRIVGKEIVGDSKISTAFSGLNLSLEKGLPVLWETRVFGGRMDQTVDRCSGSREQAEAMHREMVRRVKETL